VPYYNGLAVLFSSGTDWSHIATILCLLGCPLQKTRQLSYRKEDRAMHPIYGCPEKSCQSSLRTRLLFPKFVVDFCSDRY